MKNIFLLLLSITATTSLQAQDFSLFEKKWFIKKGDTLPYRLLLPENYDPAKQYPLIYFLHGAGERGSDNKKQLVHGAKLFLREDVRKNHPAIVVFPQCPQNSYWSNVSIQRDSTGNRKFNFHTGGTPTPPMLLAQQLLYEICKKYPVNKKQVYVGGLSMGGMGTFEIVARNPKLVAAAFPVCGGANPATAVKMKKVNWWVFHGAKDNVVPPSCSEEMVNALKQAGAPVKFTLYPDAGHNSWDAAFSEPELLPWLFLQSK